MVNILTVLSAPQSTVNFKSEQIFILARLPSSIRRYYILTSSCKAPSPAKARAVLGVCPLYHPPTTLTLLYCFSAPCGQIGACEDTFWKYSISEIQIWGLHINFMRQRTLGHIYTLYALYPRSLYSEWAEELVTKAPPAGNNCKHEHVILWRHFDKFQTIET